MGRKGSSGMGGGGNAASNGVTSSSGVNAFKTLGKKDVDEWLETQNPISFAGGDTPSTINVNGIPMQWINETKSPEGKGMKYDTYYQSSIQTTSGEYPVLKISVNEKKTKKATQYTFDKSTFGTGLQ